MQQLFNLMEHFSLRYLFFLFLPLYAAVVSATEIDGFQGFSAEMVQKTADGQSVYAKIFRAHGHSRTEYLQAGSRVVEIINPQAQKGWLIWPDAGMFAEQSLSPLAIQVALNKPGENPCEQLSGYLCKKQGEELVNGRPSSIWDVRGGNMQWREWVDRERRFPVRQQFQNGQTTERILEQVTEINGRSVELWRAVSRSGDGPTSEIAIWYDPELATNLREEVPGQMVRELLNLKIETLSSELFQVPDGLEQLSDPGR